MLIVVAAPFPISIGHSDALPHQAPAPSSHQLPTGLDEPPAPVALVNVVDRSAAGPLAVLGPSGVASSRIRTPSTRRRRFHNGGGREEVEDPSVDSSSVVVPLRRSIVEIPLSAVLRCIAPSAFGRSNDDVDAGDEWRADREARPRREWDGYSAQLCAQRRTNASAPERDDATTTTMSMNLHGATVFVRCRPLPPSGEREKGNHGAALGDEQENTGKHDDDSQRAEVENGRAARRRKLTQSSSEHDRCRDDSHHHHYHHRPRRLPDAAGAAERRPPPEVVVLLYRYGDESVAFRETFWFARFLQRQARARFAILTEMAVQQSFGGGWASVRNAARSVYHALRLYRLAAAIGDEAAQRKCKLFIGYAMVWSGRGESAAAAVDELLLPEALSAGDTVQMQRCQALMGMVRHQRSLLNRVG